MLMPVVLQLGLCVEPADNAVIKRKRETRDQREKEIKRKSARGGERGRKRETEGEREKEK